MVYWLSPSLLFIKRGEGEGGIDEMRCDEMKLGWRQKRGGRDGWTGSLGQGEESVCACARCCARGEGERGSGGDEYK